VPKTVVSVKQSFHESGLAREGILKSFALETDRNKVRSYQEEKLGMAINAKAYMDLLGVTGPTSNRGSDWRTYYSLTIWSWWLSQPRIYRQCYQSLVNSAGIRPADQSEKVKGHSCHAGTEVAIMVGADKLEVVEVFRYLVSFEHKTVP